MKNQKGGRGQNSSSPGKGYLATPRPPRVMESTRGRANSEVIQFFRLVRGRRRAEQLPLLFELVGKVGGPPVLPASGPFLIEGGDPSICGSKTLRAGQGIFELRNFEVAECASIEETSGNAPPHRILSRCPPPPKGGMTPDSFWSGGPESFGCEKSGRRGPLTTYKKGICRKHAWRIRSVRKIR